MFTFTFRACCRAKTFGSVITVVYMYLTGRRQRFSKKHQQSTFDSNRIASWSFGAFWNLDQPCTCVKVFGLPGRQIRNHPIILIIGNTNPSPLKTNRHETNPLCCTTTNSHYRYRLARKYDLKYHVVTSRPSKKILKKLASISKRVLHQLYSLTSSTWRARWR